jgi:hypothetical protein
VCGGRPWGAIREIRILRFSCLIVKAACGFRFPKRFTKPCVRPFNRAGPSRLLRIRLARFFPFWARQYGGRSCALFRGRLGLSFPRMRGVKEAAAINKIVTIAKLLPRLLFLVLTIFFLKPDVFVANLWGGVSGDYGNLFKQVKSTMLVTVFVFLGIEGASNCSRLAPNGRRRPPTDGWRAKARRRRYRHGEWCMAEELGGGGARPRQGRCYRRLARGHRLGMKPQQSQNLSTSTICSDCRAL